MGIEIVANYTSWTSDPRAFARRVKVLDSLESLGELGIDRVQVTDRLKGSVLNLPGQVGQ